MNRTGIKGSGGEGGWKGVKQTHRGRGFSKLTGGGVLANS